MCIQPSEDIGRRYTVPILRKIERNFIQIERNLQKVKVELCVNKVGRIFGFFRCKCAIIIKKKLLSMQS